MTEPSENPDAAAQAAAEDASDAQLRAWAKDNGINEVPPTGRLSSVWREYIVNAMAAALDPQQEASAQATSLTSSTPSSTSPETMTTETTDQTSQNPETDPLGDGPVTASTEPVQVPTDGPFYDPVSGRTVWQAPSTYVTSQAFTA